MAVSKDNVRTTLTIPKDLKKQLEQLAKEQNRSLNNLILTLIKKSLNEKWFSHQPNPPSKVNGIMAGFYFQWGYKTRLPRNQ